MIAKYTFKVSFYEQLTQKTAPFVKKQAFRSFFLYKFLVLIKLSLILQIVTKV